MIGSVIRCGSAWLGSSLILEAKALCEVALHFHSSRQRVQIESLEFYKLQFL